MKASATAKKSGAPAVSGRARRKPARMNKYAAGAVLILAVGFAAYQLGPYWPPWKYWGNPALVTMQVPETVEGAPNDPLFMAQWGLYEESIGWVRAKKVMDRNFPRGLSPDRNAPIVAVLDTSFELHEDLGGGLRLHNGTMYVVRQNGKKERSVVGAGSSAKAEGAHGNASMGIIAAAVDNNIGIAGTGFGVVKVMPIGTGMDTRNIISALDFVIEQKEKHKANIAVVNMSFTIIEDVYRKQVEKLGKLGVVVVVASGNSGQDIGLTPCYPAGSPAENVVAVAELAQNLRLTGSSNFGKGITIAAPGSGTLTFSLNNGYIPGGGASLSAPFVSGVLASGIALYNSRKRDGAAYDELSPAQLINLLYSTANTSPKLKGQVQNGRYINIAAFIETVEKTRDDAIRSKRRNSVPTSYPPRGVR